MSKNIKQIINFPLKYDSERKIIYESEIGILALSSRFLGFQTDFVGEWIADALNDYENLRAENENLKSEVGVKQEKYCVCEHRHTSHVTLSDNVTYCEKGCECRNYQF